MVEQSGHIKGLEPDQNSARGTESDMKMMETDVIVMCIISP